MQLLRSHWEDMIHASAYFKPKPVEQPSPPLFIPPGAPFLIRMALIRFDLLLHLCSAFVDEYILQQFLLLGPNDLIWRPGCSQTEEQI